MTRPTVTIMVPHSTVVIAVTDSMRRQSRATVSTVNPTATACVTQGLICQK
jgi:hypothetical protein